MKQESFKEQVLALLNDNKKQMDVYEKNFQVDKKFAYMDNQ